ncbi:MAG TPA: xanthine dehydrogenase family protein subunit M [Kofleriaceae bacterium]
MNAFSYVRPTSEAEALRALAEPGAVALAGGTTLVDLMRLDVMRPARVVDLGGLPLDRIDAKSGGISIGALASNTAVADHPEIRARFPVLAEAIDAGASGQIRNMASVGGNLLQRTRCSYFRDLASPCNKRSPGAGCAAFDGYTRNHAVVGGSPNCIAVHPSDMCVALLALDAVVRIKSASGERTIPMSELHVVPDRPNVETSLRPGELITAVELRDAPFAKRSRYVKVRDRASFAFALASAAVALDVEGTTINAARVALGGVATKPWREQRVEQALVGKRPTQQMFDAAAKLALADAVPRPDNAFKVALARRVIARALALAGGVS